MADWRTTKPRSTLAVRQDRTSTRSGRRTDATGDRIKPRRVRIPRSHAHIRRQARTSRGTPWQERWSARAGSSPAQSQRSTGTCQACESWTFGSARLSGEGRHKRSGADHPPNPAACWLGALLHPKFQPWPKQTFGYIILTHELHQQPMHLACFVEVILDHIVTLLGIGCQIVELRHSWVRAV